MKKYYIRPVVFFILLISCHHNKDKTAGISPKIEKGISKRNFSITAANSYNDIFFDSLELAKFISGNNIDDTLARRMISFYNARNYQYAWFASNGLTEQGRGFWNLYNYHTSYARDSLLNNKSLKKEMDRLAAEDSLTVKAGENNILQTELNLTHYFVLFALNNFEEGYVKRKELERFVPFYKQDAMAMADSLLTKKHKDNKYYEDINLPYKLLKAQLQKYYAIAKQGGWPLINIHPKELKTGASTPTILQLKKRLALSGDMSSDTTLLFDSALVSGIKKFQVRHGFTPDGMLKDELIKAINIPVEERIKQLLINMGRTQWMIEQSKGRLIVVNIPEFILHVKENNKEAWNMNVVVGKEGHNTTMFTGNLNQIVFSPYWNIPSGIVQKEIQPAMKKDKHYLARHNMEITGSDGGLPMIRQLPGGDNSLGKVKFLFPNSFDIYFHDTPARSLFAKDQRAYSHGCIRLKEPAKMAAYLLSDDPKWTSQKIDSSMNSKDESRIRIKQPVPVLITYYTAWVDENGLLHFAGDIYGHDADVAKKMFL